MGEIFNFMIFMDPQAEKIIAHLSKFPIVFLMMVETQMQSLSLEASAILDSAIKKKKDDLLQNKQTQAFSITDIQQVARLLQERMSAQEGKIKGEACGLRAILEYFGKEFFCPHYWDTLLTEKEVLATNKLINIVHKHVRAFKQNPHAVFHPPEIAEDENKLLLAIAYKAQRQFILPQFEEQLIQRVKGEIEAPEIKERETKQFKLAVTRDSFVNDKSTRDISRELHELEGDNLVTEVQSRLTQNPLMQKALIAMGSLNMLPAVVWTEYSMPLLEATNKIFSTDGAEYHFKKSGEGIRVGLKSWWRLLDQATCEFENERYRLSAHFYLLEVIKAGEKPTVLEDNVFVSAPVIQHKGEKYCYVIKWEQPEIRLEKPEPVVSSNEQATKLIESSPLKVFA